jgi:uncharacterized Zn finger protein (UPF0148 family)
MQYHCDTCDCPLIIKCCNCDDRRRKRSVDSMETDSTPETTPCTDEESIYETESESEDNDSSVNLSELEEIDETEVQDIITDREKHELADEVLKFILELGKNYRITPI